MWKGKRVGVIIPAAGIGRRMGGDRSKQFLEIAGVPILLRTLRQFETATEVDDVVVAASEKERAKVQNLIDGAHCAKIRAVVPGGRERQDSVWNGLQEMEGRNIGVILIHDAARPFVDHSLITEIISAAELFGAAIPGINVNDTMKTIEKNEFVGTTIDRTSLRRIQTPQGFTFATLMETFRDAMSKGEYGTDEASLLERRGIRIKIVEGRASNIKITTPDDLEFARLMARSMNHATS